MGYSPLDLEAPAEAPRPVVEWEESACLLCAGRRWSIVIEAPDPAPGGGGLWFAVVQCQDCGLCFTNPRPSLRSIGQFYPEQYLPHRTRPGRAAAVGTGRVSREEPRNTRKTRKSTRQTTPGNALATAGVCFSCCSWISWFLPSA